MGNPFENNEMCDGKHCRHKEHCARWMMRCDILACTPYIVFNTKPIKGKCDFFLESPNDAYPVKPENADY